MSGSDEENRIHINIEGYGSVTVERPENVKLSVAADFAALVTSEVMALVAPLPPRDWKRRIQLMIKEDSAEEQNLALAHQEALQRIAVQRAIRKPVDTSSWDADMTLISSLNAEPPGPW